jgi:hypothetical protein
MDNVVNLVAWSLSFAVLYVDEAMAEVDQLAASLDVLRFGATACTASMKTSSGKGSTLSVPCSGGGPR